MGFFSSMFGSDSEWSGSKYVEFVTGKKFWYEGFIDMDEMREHGVATAMKDDPIRSTRQMKQSPQTIVGELIYLLETCEVKRDEKGCKAVSTAIQHLLKENSEQLSISLKGEFMMTRYRNYL